MTTEMIKIINWTDIPEGYSGIVFYDSGDTYHLLNGKRHRENGPAFEGANGDKDWYINGKRHREDRPACEYSDGTKEWWVNGQRHREDGPAIEWPNGSKFWYKNNKSHREDGPAVEYPDGQKEWHLDGNYYSNKPFSIKELIVLDEYIGEYGLIWYKVITKDGETEEIPDIPDLIIK